MTLPVVIAMVEDDEGHARLIEKNLRRAGVHNECQIASKRDPGYAPNNDPLVGVV